MNELGDHVKDVGEILSAEIKNKGKVSAPLLSADEVGGVNCSVNAVDDLVVMTFFWMLRFASKFRCENWEDRFWIVATDFGSLWKEMSFFFLCQKWFVRPSFLL